MDGLGKLADQSTLNARLYTLTEEYAKKVCSCWEQGTDWPTAPELLTKAEKLAELHKNLLPLTARLNQLESRMRTEQQERTRFLAAIADLQLKRKVAESRHWGMEKIL